MPRPIAETDEVVLTRYTVTNASWKWTDRLGQVVIKPGDLIRPPFDFPTQDIFYFKENYKREKDLYRTLPLFYHLKSPQSWPDSWTLVPMSDLPYKDFTLPPLFYLGEYVKCNKLIFASSYSRSNIALNRLVKNKAMIAFLLGGEKIYIPNTDIENQGYQPLNQ